MKRSASPCTRTLRLIFAALFLLPSLLAVSACEDRAADGAAPPGEAAGSYSLPVAPTARAPRLLPAHKTAAERRRAAEKADWGWERAAHPEWYTITEPPHVGSHRPMTEWEPMQANLIAYVDYLADDAPVRDTMVEIAVRTIAVADLWVLYQSNGMKQDLTNRLVAAGLSSRTVNDRVRFLPIANDSIWFIDFGPLPIIDDGAGTFAFLDWRYYADTDRVLDDAVPTRLGKAVGVTTYRQPFDIEGGNFQADAQGTCYTTERAFEYAGTPETLELQLRYYAGCRELVVLRDIWNDGTGHIDMFFKLVSDDVAIVGQYAPGQDERARVDMDWNANLLQSRGLTVHRMPMPAAVRDWFDVIPRTYLNSTFINGPRGKVNLWPVYSADQTKQTQALRVWQEAMPDWQHIGIDADQLSLYSGAIHCITRTIPALPTAKWVPDGDCTGSSCSAPEHGYDGTCRADADCFGPDWLCSTNACVFAPDDPCDTEADCEVAADGCQTAACLGGLCRYTSSCAAGENCFLGTCVTGCGDLPYEGCCDGTAAWYCNTQTGALVRTQCGTGEAVGAPYCGWTGSQYGYDCMTTQGGADPSGGFPRECGAYVSAGCVSDTDCPTSDPCAPVRCVDSRCVPQPIQCPADDDPCTDEVCVGGACTTRPSPECCATDAECDDENACTTDACVEGRCAHTAKQCPAGQTCNPATGQCAAGCVPQCAGRQCGADGCGGSCGTCGGGAQCFVGMCVNDCVGVPYEGCCDGAVAWYCNPQAGTLVSEPCGEGQAAAYPFCGWTGPQNGYYCSDAEVGAEPSGALPLECEAYLICLDADCDEGEICDPVAGGCVPDPNTVCDEMPFEGCCEGDSVVWCEDGLRYSADCGQNSPPTTCGWDGDNGFFNCVATAPTPPAGITAVCPGGCATVADCDDGELCTEDSCVDGRCRFTRIPGCCVAVSDCNDRNPCTTDSCSNNQCGWTAIPDCTCTVALCDDANPCTTEVCGADGLCVYTRVPGCCNEARDCNDRNVCTEDTCVANGCVHTEIAGCQQPCEAHSDCLDADICTNDRCVAGFCDHSRIVGCCTQDAHCGDASLCTIDSCGDNNACVHVPKTCDAGLICNPNSGNCEPPCTPSCAGKVCGDNGCGGSCGTCPVGFTCGDDGERCVETCSCIGMECGVPAAGCPPCGQCADGEECNTFFQCVPSATRRDTTGGPDSAGRPDAAGTDVVTGGGGGGGCATAPAGAPAAPWALLLLLGAVAALRRRVGARR
jgi:agmatine/peptidylarginine deiminase